MKYAVLLLCVYAGIVWPAGLRAQAGRPDMKFGNVNAATFASPVDATDSNANAVILFDRGLVNFDQSVASGYGFNVVYERHTRVLLVNKNAFGLSTITLAVSAKGASGIEIEDLKGATYNLEDGKVVVSKVDKSNIFHEENGAFSFEKIVFPSVKEGSVIEYSYRVVYPGFGYVPFWEFQGEYPIRWSEYDITIPETIDYTMEKQGYLRFTVDSTNGNERIWAIRDAPPIGTREPYITTLKNYISKIEFQLSAVHFPRLDRSFRTTWSELVDELMKNDNFGKPLTDRDHWMMDELKTINGGDMDHGGAGGGKTDLGSVRNIYRYVRDHFDCSKPEGIYLTQPLKKTWEDKKGNVADINLLLTSLLRHQGLDAVPVLLSTRMHGTAFEGYPLLKDYNYVIVRVRIGDRTILADATRTYIDLGQLPDWCYNGSGRAIDAEHDLISMQTDSLLERRNTVVELGNNDSLGYSGRLVHTSGAFESMELRSRIKRIKPEGFFDNLRKGLASNKTMGESGIDSLDDMGSAVVWHYTMKYAFTTPTVYFHPIMHERVNTNPFVSPERHYPVEMPYCMDYSYALDMEIPKGYSVSEAPRSQRVLLDGGNSAMFEYIVVKDSMRLRITYRLKINKTFFDTSEYRGLRDFYDLIVRKEKEQVVFKKNEP